MDTPAVAELQLKAGHEYVDALATLGFDPFLVTWAYDEVTEEQVLLIATDFYDYKGPLAITEKLFEAYNLSLTPREIDPFHVRLHSGEQPFIQELLRYAKGGWIQKSNGYNGSPIGDRIPFTGGSVGGIHVNRAWVIKMRPMKRRPVDSLMRNWKRFEKNLERAAA